MASSIAPLPFSSTDSLPEFNMSHRPFPPWDLEILNYVTLDTWTSLRVPKSKAFEDLSMFPSMHLDIILEVFSHLHPLDLLSVARSCREFRDLLHSPTAESTWWNAFTGDGSVEHPVPMPTPPPKSIPTARRWAALIYGHNICDECGASETVPDFYLWRRLCTGCMNDLLCTELPGYALGHEIYNLIPKTTRCVGDVLEGWADPPQFDPAEGKAILELYERYKFADDPTELNRYIEWQKAVVEEIESAADKCIKVEKRFSKDGWDKEDIEEASWSYRESIHLYRVSVVSRRFWRRIRSFIIPEVSAAYTRRLEAERRILISERKSAVKGWVLNTLSTPVLGSSTIFYPPPHNVCNFPGFIPLVDDPSDDPLAPDDPRLLSALEEAVGLVDKWCLKQKALLAALFPVSAGIGDDVLTLATSVFRIPLWNWDGPLRWAVVVGWSGAQQYLHYFESGAPVHEGRVREVEVCERGAETARYLVGLLGLRQAANVTEADMDRVGARFVCAQCPIVKPGRAAFPWRECIEHDVGHSDDDDLNPHTVPSWLLLSAVATQDVLRREGDEHSTGKIPHWPCAVAVPGRDGANSVRTGPGPRRTLVFQPSYIRYPRLRRAFLNEAGAHPAIYRCKQCAADRPHNVKLFSGRSIQAHVVDRHSVDAPGGEDWTKEELFVSL
ncbi:hypothetical protein FB45DRAFT_877369 [Roridomyces roridus]|uniref:F-box domain-containing protein n=1 Tax=Roridomyces roridus TaxID=1738132 RepID=A0AAD7B1V6_9AGAR|nr:hypothetical protein FB45DRAFT_877369 [Roridomyces roridus]